MNSYKIKKILIFQTAFAGDVILTTPLISATKRFFPDAEIHFIAIPSTIDIIKNNPNITNVISYDKRRSEKGFLKIFDFATKLRTENYDLALVPHRSIRSAFIVWLANIPIRLGFNKSSGSFLFTDKVIYKNDIHEIERNLSLLTKFSTDIPNELPAIYPGKINMEKVEQLLTNWKIKNSKSLIAIAPGSIWPTKCWPENKFIELIQELLTTANNFAIVLIGGKDDEHLCMRIQAKCRQSVYSAAGLLNLRESAELIRRCNLLICNDSAPTHIGVAMKTKVLTIFGPTIPAFGFYPYGKNDVVIEHENLYCRPCGIHGGRKCPEAHFRCMQEISAESVLNEILKNENSIY